MFPKRTKAAWEEVMQINAAIPNDRIVCCHDNAVFPGFPAEKRDEREFTMVSV